MKWLPDIQKSCIQVIRKGSDALKLNAEVVIVSYDLATRQVERLKRFGFKIAIVDEAHYLKSLSVSMKEESQIDQRSLYLTCLK